MVDVGLAHGLLRRHVVRRADGQAHGGELLAPRGAHRLGHAEVGDQGVALGDQDVVGLDVAVDDPPPVRVRQGLRDFAQDGDHGGGRERAFALDPRAQGLALDERHHVVHDVAGAAGGEERDDVGVLQSGGDLDLAPEPLDADVGGRLGREHLRTQERMSKVLKARRQDKRTAAFFRLTGLEMKMNQYKMGERFIEVVEREAGWDTVGLAFRGASSLPTLDEIGSPERWLSRVA